MYYVYIHWSSSIQEKCLETVTFRKLIFLMKIWTLCILKLYPVSNRALSLEHKTEIMIDRSSVTNGRSFEWCDFCK